MERLETILSALLAISIFLNVVGAIYIREAVKRLLSISLELFFKRGPLASFSISGSFFLWEESRDKIRYLSSSGPFSLGSISEEFLTLSSNRDNWFINVSIYFLNSGSALASIIENIAP